MTEEAAPDLFAWAVQSRRNVVAPAPQNPCTLPDPPPEALAIREALRGALSMETAITAPRIAAAAGLWPDNRPADRGTKAREIMTVWYEHIQEPGRVLIAGTCGYWHSNDPVEVTAYLRTLRSRARETFSRLRRARIQAQFAGMQHIGHGQIVA